MCPRFTFPLALILTVAVRTASADCPTKDVKLTREPIEVFVENQYSTSPNSDPTDCTTHGPLTLRVTTGSTLISTFAFTSGETVIVDWIKKTVAGRYEGGVEVDFKKGRATFTKSLVRLELVTRRFTGSQRLSQFTREQLLTGKVEEESITFIPE